MIVHLYHGTLYSRFGLLQQNTADRQLITTACISYSSGSRDIQNLGTGRLCLRGRLPSTFLGSYALNLVSVKVRE